MSPEHKIQEIQPEPLITKIEDRVTPPKQSEPASMEFPTTHEECAANMVLLKLPVPKTKIPIKKSKPLNKHTSHTLAPQHR